MFCLLQLENPLIYFHFVAQDLAGLAIPFKHFRPFFPSVADSNVKLMANRTSDNDLRYETEPIFKTSAKPKGSSSDQFQVETVSLGMSESYERRIATDSSLSHKPCETPSIRKQMNKEVFQESTKSDGVKSPLKTSERAETTSFCVGGEFGLDSQQTGAAVPERSVFGSVFTTKPQLHPDVDSFDQFPEEYTMEVPPQEVQPTGLFGSSLATDGGGLFASSSISQATQEAQPTTLLGQSFAAGKGGYVGFSSISPPTQKPSPLQPSFFGPAPKGFLFGQLSQAAEKHTHETGPVLTDQKPQAVALASEARPKGMSGFSSDERLQDQQITGSCASPIVVGKGLAQPQPPSLPVLPEMSTTTSRKGFSLGQPVAAQAKPVGNYGFSFGSSQISARPLASQVPQIGTGRFGRVSQTAGFFGTVRHPIPPPPPSAQLQSASPPVPGAAFAALLQSALTPETSIALHPPPPPPPPPPPLASTASLLPPQAPPKPPLPAVMGALPPFCMKGGIRKMKNAGLSSEVSSVKELLSEVLRECEAKSMATSSLSLGEGDSHAKKEKKAKDEKSVATSAEAVEQPEPIQTTPPPFEASPPPLRRRLQARREKKAFRRPGKMKMNEMYRRRVLDRLFYLKLIHLLVLKVLLSVIFFLFLAHSLKSVPEFYLMK